MKITTKVPHLVQVGVRYPPQTFYNDGRLPSWAAHGPASAPAYETRLKAITVFDYDFKAARRAAGVGRLVALSTAVVVLFPLSVIALAAEVIDKSLVQFGEFVTDGLHAINALPGWTLRQNFAGVIREIVQ